ncbi:MAG: hypothetical protein M1376_18750 [Planctomycetes bacterium]|nr:hypothetical protein [Planctomycetota bacterium]
MLAGLLLMAGARAAAAKSLYVIADVEYGEEQIRVHAYDIAPDGKLTFQAQGYVPLYGAKALGLALDSDSRHLFLTCLTSNVITLLDAVTLQGEGATRVEGARSLTGVVYDHGNGLLYCVDGITPNLYVYRWNPGRHELTPAPGSPVRLETAAPGGIALDEVTGELYVCDSSRSIGVYHTLDWRLVKTIAVSRVAAHVAVDSIRGYLYYGAGDLGNIYLSRYDPTTGTEVETRVGNRIGVLGLAVDRITGFVFASTGAANCPDCGDDVCVFDGNLVEIDAARKVGEPTGLVVSDGRTTFNPLRLTKTIKTPAGDGTAGMDVSEVVVGEEVAYSICFDHNDLPLTQIVLVDRLPAELAFVRATGDGLYGRYDPQAHTYTWVDPPLTRGATTCLELVARLDPNTPVHQLVTNSVTIDSNETPPTTAEAHVVAVGPAEYQPLHVGKAVIVGATGGGTSPLSTRPGDELTYRITFDNKGNEYAVENVRLTDTLPPGTEFVRATGDREFGRYEPLTHTYTWSYPRLAPGESNSADLVLRVDPEAEIGATLHNAVLLVSDNTTAVTAAADVMVGSFAPLQLQKTLVRGGVGQPDEQGRWSVDAGSTLTYAIYFSNPSANKTVTDISVVDTLPREVSFVSADGSRDLGFYDPNTHTYSWHYASLGPGLEQTLNLTVRVNDRVDPGTVISNSVAVTAKQTTTVKVHSDVVVRTVLTDLPLRLEKTLVQGLAASLPDVRPDAILTYAISFSNPATNETATQIALVDTLPREVNFVSADGDREFGSYDAGTHTYTWRYALLAPGEEEVVHLTVQVNEKAVPGTVMANAATIRPSEMPPTTARLELPVSGPPFILSLMYIKPDHIYRNYPKAQADLMVVVHLPEGTGAGAISNSALVLTPGNIKATGQQIFGTSTQGKVLCFFDVDAILAVTNGYGEFPLKVTGQLRDGRSFVAQTTIWILKFGGP